MSLNILSRHLFWAERSQDDEEEEEKPDEGRDDEREVPGVEPALRKVLDLRRKKMKMSELCFTSVTKPHPDFFIKGTLAFLTWDFA